jgi:hypothetical protein
MVQKSFLVVLCLLLLNNCSSKAEPLIIDTAPVVINIEQPEQPNAIVLSDIRWKVLNIDNSIYYGLSVSDYELLASNMLDIKRYILAQKNIIIYYEDVTKIK